MHPLIMIIFFFVEVGAPYLDVNMNFNCQIDQSWFILFRAFLTLSHGLNAKLYTPRPPSFPPYFHNR